MGWLSGQLIDIIEWMDDGQETMVYRFERHNNEIKNGAKLICRENQAAILVNEGQLADIFGPGTHTLSTHIAPRSVLSRRGSTCSAGPRIPWCGH